MTTAEQIQAAVLALLAPTGTTTLVPFRKIRAHLPGDWWQQTEALTTLFEAYRVSTVKVRGSVYVRLADDWDRQAAAYERDRAAQAGFPMPRCRDSVVV